MHHSERLTYGLIFLVLALVAIAAYVFLIPHHKTTQIFLGSTTYSMQVVSSDAKRNQLLQKEESLKNNHGVLVAYPDDAKHSIALKNLHVKSDVLWLDNNKNIVYQVKGLPAVANDKMFGVNKPSRYMLLFASGVIERQKPLNGSSVSFDLNSLW
ncbi:MAG: DUF192 domain-containing protein [Segetibacter sp.]